MLHNQFTTFLQRWDFHLSPQKSPPEPTPLEPILPEPTPPEPTPPEPILPEPTLPEPTPSESTPPEPTPHELTLPAERPPWSELTATSEADLPFLLRQSAVALRYLHFLGDLDWDHFPERSEQRAWPGPKPAPRAPFVAAFLVKLQEKKEYMSELRTFLVEHPALVWLLGFPLVPDPASLYGFDVEATVPSRKQLGRVLRTLRSEQCRFLLRKTVRLLEEELPPDVGFGNEISLDTKHILAWVKENNPKERLSDRFNKTRQPQGDRDCKLGFKPMSNQRNGATAASTTGDAPTPTTEGAPASQTKIPKEGQYLWGYASGVVATKVKGWGEFALAELTQTFDKSDISYFFPLMDQTEEHLGRKAANGALDAAFDAFYVHAYFHEAGGFAAIPWADRADHRKSFDAEGRPLCAAGLAMPLQSTFFKQKHCLVPHECGRYGCPLATDEGEEKSCPVNHANWEKKGGCVTTLPLSPGSRIRHELDRDSQAYKQLYRQRSATERINSQAVNLGVEHPHLRHKSAIANLTTLIYVVINLRALRRVRILKEVRNRNG